MPKKKDYTPSNRLSEIRKSRKLTLQNVADRAKTTTAQIHRLETGEREFTLAWMQRLADGFDVSPADQLLPEDGGLDPDERKLIVTLREVPASGRACFFAMVEALQPFRSRPNS